MWRQYAERLPFIRGLKHQANMHKAAANAWRLELEALKEKFATYIALQGMFPPGHYYSPIPSPEDLRAYLARRQMPEGDIPGISMNAEDQRMLLDEFAHYYPDALFPEQPSPGHRYYHANIWFGYSDAMMLHGFLRRYRPQRIIEVGSGFSSAVMLDTIDRHPGYQPALTFIEPFPERLDMLMTEADHEHTTLLESNVQQVPLEQFKQLEVGDLLFIDSSHVVKAGSDLQYLLFEVLPCLQPGVYVHFHDVFYPFDYPDEWLTEGRYWNENYFLRAFLAWNEQWQIRLFGSYVHHAFADLISEKLPLCAGSPGGSLYLQRSTS